MVVAVATRLHSSCNNEWNSSAACVRVEEEEEASAEVDPAADSVDVVVEDRVEDSEAGVAAVVEVADSL